MSDKLSPEDRERIKQDSPLGTGMVYMLEKVDKIDDNLNDFKQEMTQRMTATEIKTNSLTLDMKEMKNDIDKIKNKSVFDSFDEVWKRGKKLYIIIGLLIVIISGVTSVFIYLQDKL